MTEEKIKQLWYKWGRIGMDPNEFITLVKEISDINTSTPEVIFHLDILDPLISDICVESEKALKANGYFESLHEAYGVLAEEVDEFFVEVKQKEQNAERAEAELIQIAAVALRAAYQLRVGERLKKLVPKGKLFGEVMV